MFVWLCVFVLSFISIYRLSLNDVKISVICPVFAHSTKSHSIKSTTWAYIRLAMSWVPMLHFHDVIPQSFLLKQMQTLLYKFQKYLYNLNWSAIFTKVWALFFNCLYSHFSSHSMTLVTMASCIFLYLRFYSAQTSICFSTRSHLPSPFAIILLLLHFPYNTKCTQHNDYLGNEWYRNWKLMSVSIVHSFTSPKTTCRQISTLCTLTQSAFHFPFHCSSGICFNWAEQQFQAWAKRKETSQSFAKKNYTHFIYFECHLKSFNLKNGWNANKMTFIILFLCTNKNEMNRTMWIEQVMQL